MTHEADPEHAGAPGKPGRGGALSDTPGSDNTAGSGSAGEKIAGGGGVPFGAALAPALVEACGGKLSDITWFRTQWQRGGALTGYATWDDGGSSGGVKKVVVKMPVPPRERRWLVALHAGPNPAVPWVFANGQELAGYDFAWVVMERLPFGPLGEAWGGREFDLIVDAAGRFYAATADAPIDPAWSPRKRDWTKILGDARKHVQDRGVRESQRWKAALKRANKKLDGWVDTWHGRGFDDWCHGDLHLGNALSVAAPGQDDDATDTARLIDLAEVRVGHWVEDAVYLEHLYWSARQRLGDRKIVSMVARERKRRGLNVGENWPELARVKRLLLAVSTATRLHEVTTGHADAALELLEAEVG